MITYQQEPDLIAAEFAAILHGSGLAPRRPAEMERPEAMLRDAQLVITARDGARLVACTVDHGLGPIACIVPICASMQATRAGGSARRC